MHFVGYWDESTRMKSIDTLKKVLAGEPLSTDMKGKDHKLIEFKLPIIMITNRDFDEFLDGLTESEKQGEIFCCALSIYFRDLYSDNFLLVIY